MAVPNEIPPPALGSRAVPPAILGAMVFALFLVWSNNFIAVGYLLGSEASGGRFDWVELTVARFLPAGLIAAMYCLLRRREESSEVMRRHPRRLLACGFFAVPCSNLTLYYGQQQGVPAPIASLTTALVPLFVIALSRLVLRETLTARQYIGFGIALLGMIVIATGPRTAGVVAGTTTEDRLTRFSHRIDQDERASRFGVPSCLALAEGGLWYDEILVGQWGKQLRARSLGFSGMRLPSRLDGLIMLSAAGRATATARLA